MSLKTTIIGDGAMGTLCAIMLCENGHAVGMWSHDADYAEELARTRTNRRYLPGTELPDALEITGRDAEAFEGAELIVAATPAQYARGVWQRLAEYVPGGVGICTITKGIENETLLRPTEVLSDVLGDTARPLAALSGPSIAPEIVERKPASVAVASFQKPFAITVQEAITRPYFRVYTNPDPVGLELAGATKNVIAIAAGILDGLEAGCNAKAALLTRGLAEITRLGEALGARAETFAGLGGFGDLVTTCISPVGRNRSFGQAVGSGQSVDDALGATESVVEGVATCRSVVDLAARCDVPMPITRAVWDVLFQGRSPREAIHELMTRPLKSELA